MEIERIIEKTLINERVTVITTDAENSEVLLTGVHATARTFVTGMDGTDGKVPVATYINKGAARVGHDMVVEQTRRALLKQRAIEEYGISPQLVDGVL